MTDMKHELGVATEHEVRDLIARTLVRESAQAAGLEVALPYGEGLGGRLLVFGDGEGPGEPVRGRWVHVGYRGYRDLVDSALPEMGPGGLLPLHDVAAAEPEVVFLLPAEELNRSSGAAVAMHEEWRATAERWRASVVG